MSNYIGFRLSPSELQALSSRRRGDESLAQAAKRLFTTTLTTSGALVAVTPDNTADNSADNTAIIYDNTADNSADNTAIISDNNTDNSADNTAIISDNNTDNRADNTAIISDNNTDNTVNLDTATIADVLAGIAILEYGLDAVVGVSVNALQQKQAELAAVEADKHRLSELAVLAAASNQELREKMESVERDKLAAIATATALEKQLDVANKENEELRNRLEKLPAGNAAPPVVASGGFSLGTLRAMVEPYLGSKSETTAKNYRIAVNKFLEFVGN